MSAEIKKQVQKVEDTFFSPVVILYKADDDSKEIESEGHPS